MSTQRIKELQAARDFTKSALDGNVQIDFAKGVARFGEMQVTRDPKNDQIWHFTTGGTWAEHSLLHVKDAASLEIRVKETLRETLNDLGDDIESLEYDF